MQFSDSGCALSAGWGHRRGLAKGAWVMERGLAPCGCPVPSPELRDMSTSEGAGCRIRSVCHALSLISPSRENLCGSVFFFFFFLGWDFRTLLGVGGLVPLPGQSQSGVSTSRTAPAPNTVLYLAVKRPSRGGFAAGIPWEKGISKWENFGGDPRDVCIPCCCVSQADTFTKVLEWEKSD